MTRTGLQRLLASSPRSLRKARLGLVAHAAAILPDLSGAVEALTAAGYKLTALFGPEHGFGGAAADGAKVGHFTDPRSGLPVFSLYGQTLQPTEAMLSGIDVLLFDMQDVGARFYTYLSTLFYVLKAAGQHSKPVYVLDRPNPITGLILEGGGVSAGFESFVGIANLPIRHGMTLGELAGLLNAEYALGADLHVMALKGWRRQMWFDQTGLPWAPPSPAMPHLSTAIVYPGMCLLEGTPLSLGRGTSLPFEVCGAPRLDGYALAKELNALGLPGVRFRPIVFTPWDSKHTGRECGGVQVYVTDRERFRPLTMALHLLTTVRRLWDDEWQWETHFDRLTGGGEIRSALDAGVPPEEIAARWAAFLSGFAHRREPYLLYA